jgi:hypothetical protein
MLCASDTRENWVALEFYFCLVCGCFRLLYLTSILNVDLCIDNEDTLFFFQFFFEILMKSYGSPCSFMVTLEDIVLSGFKVHFRSKSIIELFQTKLILELIVTSRPCAYIFSIFISFMQKNAASDLNLLQKVGLTKFFFLEHDFFHDLRLIILMLFELWVKFSFFLLRLLMCYRLSRTVPKRFLVAF